MKVDRHINLLTFLRRFLGFSATSRIRFFYIILLTCMFWRCTNFVRRNVTYFKNEHDHKRKKIYQYANLIKKIEVFSPITTVYLGRQHSLTEIHLSQNAGHWKWIVLAIILLKLMSIIIIIFRDKRFYQAHFASHQSQMPEKICSQFSRSSTW